MRALPTVRILLGLAGGKGKRLALARLNASVQYCPRLHSSFLTVLRLLDEVVSGGFGAMLRNLGKNIDTKNMNYDACRDLSGRRMRHVSNEKKLKDW